MSNNKVGRPKNSVINEEEKPIFEQKPIEKRKVVEIDRNALIPCKSVVYGQLTYISPRTGIQYIWHDYGSEEMIEFGELITMRSSYPKFMTKPWILIDDEEVVDYFRLKDIYDKLLPLDNITEFLKKPFNEIEVMFNSAPSGMKQSFSEKVNEMVAKETLTDLRIITLVDKALGTGIKEFIK